MKKRIFWTIFLVAIIGAGATSAYIFRDDIKGFFQPHKHAYELTEDVAPSCTGDGKKIYSCIGCDETTEETIPATGHTEEVVPGYSATCKNPGLTNGSKCSVCEETLTAQEEIPALGHDVVDGECSRCEYLDFAVIYPDGYDLVKIQENENMASSLIYLGEVGAETSCVYIVSTGMMPGSIVNGVSYGATLGEIFEYDGHYFAQVAPYFAVVFKSGDAYFVQSHNEEIVPGYSATCKNPGLTDGSKCTTCEKVYVEQEEIPALGHDFMDGACSNCGVATVDSLWTLPASEGYVVDGNELTFAGTHELTFSTKEKYNSITLTFNVSETQDVRGAFQIGWGAQSTDASINTLPFVQFNYDRAVLVLPDGTKYDTSWLTGTTWRLTIDAENSNVVLSVDGEVVYNVDASWWTQEGWGLPGYLILRAESNCALTFELTEMMPN